ncbi:MAG: heparinase II/III-family protein [Saprospiraceae bacterium]|nr:heparinase II/III-family protein [Saprospiraceae bacterium]
MKSIVLLLPLLLLVSATKALAQATPSLENPFDTEYLMNNIAPSTPRLILTPEARAHLRLAVKEEGVVKNYFAALKLNAEEILTEPLLERKKVGRRLLAISREMLYRMGVLGMVYSIEPKDRYLDRIEGELRAVCGFSDWNPSHYLDVAEMSLALALAIDWVGDDLPEQLVSEVKDNLVDKGIMPSFDSDRRMGWISSNNNWNQVCNGGMIAASIAVAEEYPELAAKTIKRSLAGIPNALHEYGPDGVYPEGSTYWGYGTSFSVMTSSLLQSAFGTDFGLAEYPSFLESANFRVLANTPSGMYYNFADCGDRRSENGDITLAWFADYTGNGLYFEKERFLRAPQEMGKLSRISGPGLVWLANFRERNTTSLPTAWKGEGSNPVVFFTDEENGYYFGGKGGRGSVNHGNMDAGSFIYELNGVRWIIDPGNQRYHDLEKTGFSLWARCQDCERWTLLTKNNFGHSTLTVNNQLHVVDGMATITQFGTGAQPTCTIDMSPVFAGTLEQAKRVYTKEDNASLLITDVIKPNDSTEVVTWQVMTQADVEFAPDGLVLRQDGQRLYVENLSHPDLQFSVISLDPPPLLLDRKIEGLKRLELRIPAYLLDGQESTISLRLTANSTR